MIPALLKRAQETPSASVRTRGGRNVESLSMVVGHLEARYGSVRSRETIRLPLQLLHW